MTPRKKNTRSELARYFQEHKSDEGEWADEAVEATVGRTQSIVYSVRFQKQELAELRRVAAAEGVTLSELIRASTLDHVRESRQPGVEVASPQAKILFFSGTPGPRIGTRGSTATTLPVAEAGTH